MKHDNVVDLTIMTECVLFGGFSPFIVGSTETFVIGVLPSFLLGDRSQVDLERSSSWILHQRFLHSLHGQYIRAPTRWSGLLTDTLN